MKKLLMLVVAVTLAASIALAQQDAETEGPTDPTDLSRYEDLITQGVLPSVPGVAEARQRAEAAVNAGDCEAAIDLLDEWIRQANWLSNLIAQGLEPFYGASYDEREDFSFSRISQLADVESVGNSYKSDRNEAMVMRAECLLQNGNVAEAAATFAGALDLIEIDNWDLWLRAMNGLYALIGVEAIEN